MTWVRLATPAEMPALFALRHEVFVVGQDVPEDLERDGLDEACTHFIAGDGSGILGTARLRMTADGHAKAERVAVRASSRGAGVGAALMRALEAEARRLHLHEVVLNAQVAVVPFYLGLGYLPEGPQFEEAGIAHQFMRHRLG